LGLTVKPTAYFMRCGDIAALTDVASNLLTKGKRENWFAAFKPPTHSSRRLDRG